MKYDTKWRLVLDVDSSIPNPSSYVSSHTSMISFQNLAFIPPETLQYNNYLPSRSIAWTLGLLLWSLFNECEIPYLSDPSVSKYLNDNMKCTPEHSETAFKALQTRICEGEILDFSESPLLKALEAKGGAYVEVSRSLTEIYNLLVHKDFHKRISVPVGAASSNPFSIIKNLKGEIAHLYARFPSVSSGFKPPPTTKLISRQLDAFDGNPGIFGEITKANYISSEKVLPFSHPSIAPLSELSRHVESTIHDLPCLECFCQGGDQHIQFSSMKLSFVGTPSLKGFRFKVTGDRIPHFLSFTFTRASGTKLSILCSTEKARQNATYFVPFKVDRVNYCEIKCISTWYCSDPKPECRFDSLQFILTAKEATLAEEERTKFLSERDKCVIPCGFVPNRTYKSPLIPLDSPSTIKIPKGKITANLAHKTRLFTVQDCLVGKTRAKFFSITLPMPAACHVGAIHLYSNPANNGVRFLDVELKFSGGSTITKVFNFPESKEGWFVLPINEKSIVSCTIKSIESCTGLKWSEIAALSVISPPAPTPTPPVASPSTPSRKKKTPDLPVISSLSGISSKCIIGKGAFGDAILVELVDLYGVKETQFAVLKRLQATKIQEGDCFVKSMKKESKTQLKLFNACPDRIPKPLYILDIIPPSNPSSRVYGIMMEYCKGLSVKEFTKTWARDKKGNGYDPLKLASVSMQMILCLAEISEKASKRSLVHRDIKPENFLVRVDDRNCCKVVLADFGLATVRDSLSKSSLHVPVARDLDKEKEYDDKGKEEKKKITGTIKYNAPEGLSRGCYNSASDLFSLAISIYSMFNHELEPPPYHGCYTPTDLLSYLKKHGAPDITRLPKFLELKKAHKNGVQLFSTLEYIYHELTIINEKERTMTIKEAKSLVYEVIHLVPNLLPYDGWVCPSTDRLIDKLLDEHGNVSIVPPDEDEEEEEEEEEDGGELKVPGPINW
ncbi:hypothetical protein ADUPG1_008072 [Aduncisulcus paluster]|uniref:Protein kinase domain-containing protein n=1 Tax=Aduncisulcus paluster TaxID=2918883 RepID=A0ABQ5KQM3_9EUKA|nr:hypothetical protein ADUPG1_008072 [Aduncisulcus paluster]